MEENKSGILLSNVIAICEAYNADPTVGNEAYHKFMELKGQLIIREYLPMAQKIVKLYRCVLDADISIEMAAPAFTASLEVAMCINGLIGYTNIENDLAPGLRTYEVYDSLYQSGLADYILQHCQADYQRMARMMERTLEYSNLRELLETMKQFDAQEFKQGVAELKEAVESMDADAMRSAAQIIKYNDPALYTLKQSISESALSQLEDMDRLERAQAEAKK